MSVSKNTVHPPDSSILEPQGHGQSQRFGSQGQGKDLMYQGLGLTKAKN